MLKIIIMKTGKGTGDGLMSRSSKFYFYIHTHTYIYIYIYIYIHTYIYILYIKCQLIFGDRARKSSVKLCANLKKGNSFDFSLQLSLKS